VNAGAWVSGLDRALLLAFRVPGHPGLAVGPRWLQESARDVTALGGFTVLTLVSVLALIVMLRRGRRREAVVFGATVALAQVLSEGLKGWIERPRPLLVSHLDLVYSSSFPSGHAMMSPAVYLTLAGIMANGARRSGEGALWIAVAALLTTAIGVSRVYLGVHWPSDVLGGWILGGAIAAGATGVLRRGPLAAAPSTPSEVLSSTPRPPPP
jgi:undecaprenyl-diphosphatase